MALSLISLVIALVIGFRGVLQFSQIHPSLLIKGCNIPAENKLSSHSAFPRQATTHCLRLQCVQKRHFKIKRGETGACLGETLILSSINRRELSTIWRYHDISCRSKPSSAAQRFLSLMERQNRLPFSIRARSEWMARTGCLDHAGGLA